MRLRATWSARVEAGQVDCARCGRTILPGQPWDLGHAVDRAMGGRDSDGLYPEHARCNRAAGGRLAQAMTRRPRPPTVSRRPWT